jgi:paired amphipathic helix protein Sin3a
MDEYYAAMLEMIRNVLDGKLESNLYQDSMRELYGINAYVSYTLDKVLTKAVRQVSNHKKD